MKTKQKKNEIASDVPVNFSNAELKQKIEEVQKTSTTKSLKKGVKKNESRNR